MADDAPKVDLPSGLFGAMADAATWFVGLFWAGGDLLLALVTAIVLVLIVLLTAVNALIRVIGPERIDKVGEMAARPGLQWYPVRYLVLPFLSVFFLTNPMAYMGRFVHPITGIVPHADAGELFAYLGIAGGITSLGFKTSDLAVRDLLVGLVVIRGVVTELVTSGMLSRRVRQSTDTEVPA